LLTKPKEHGSQERQLRGRQHHEDCSRNINDYFFFFSLKKDFKGYQVIPFQIESRNTRDHVVGRKLTASLKWSRGLGEEAIQSVLKGQDLNSARKMKFLVHIPTPPGSGEQITFFRLQ
jgi:hypothetical protein